MMEAMLRWLLPITIVVACSCSISTNRQGGVRVISSVPDAVLYVDEEIQGPVRAFERQYVYVDPGPHRLMLEHPDHFTEFIDVDVPSNRGVAVRVEMRRRPE
jgi:hypothetical protein